MRDWYIGRKTFSTCAQSALAPLIAKPPYKQLQTMPRGESGYCQKCDKTLSATNSARHRRTCRCTGHTREAEERNGNG